MATNLLGLTNVCGTRFTPGTRSKLYLIPKGELDAWPQTDAELGGTDQGDTKILGEAFSFVATSGLGYWREYDILVDTGAVNETLEGEIGGQAIVSRVNFFIMGVAAKQKEFADNILDYAGCLIAMIADKSGNYHVIGDLNDPCFIETIEGGTGTTPGDRVGYAYTLYANTGKTSMLYNSTLGVNTTPNV
jgi:hypothetical protein